MNSIGLLGHLIGRVNKKVGPILLRNGIALRYTLGGGVIRENVILDNTLLINWAQKIISVEVDDDMRRLKEEEPQKRKPKCDRERDQGDGGATSSEMAEEAMRIRVLESYLRPVLLKNEKFSDVVKWRFNIRLIKWLRAEFLKAKFGSKLKGTFQGFPKLRSLPQLRRDTPNRTGSLFLPSTAMIEDAFELHEWNHDKNSRLLTTNAGQIASKVGGSIVEARGGALLLADIPMDADLSTLSLEDVLEVVGGHVTFCGAFNALCEEANIYQLWTKEFVERLAKYLMKRTNKFHGETVILDVGAGDGLLAEYLHSTIGKSLLSDANTKKSSPRTKGPKPRRTTHKANTDVSSQHIKVPNIVAVDDGSWKIGEKAKVLRLGVEEALSQYTGETQTIVLCSWMPMNVDWTSRFRDFEVNEYILIGETDDGTCGDNWETWGNPAFLSDDISEELMGSSLHDNAANAPEAHNAREKIPPPYEIDGYKRLEMDFLAPHQFSRFDSSVSKAGRTVVFRSL